MSRDKCDHLFAIKHARGHDYVCCMRCFYLPSTESLLAAYIKVNGGTRWP
jgi:hypothetical protein